MNTKQILILAAILCYYFYSSYRNAKKQKEEKDKKVSPIPEKKHYEYVPMHTNTQPIQQPAINTVEATSLEDFSSIRSKMGDFSSLETQSRDEIMKDKNQTNKEKNLLQNIDNKEENPIHLNFDRDEFVRGIIYAEILKRPYN